MGRKIIAGTVIGLCSILLGVSLALIGLIWVNKGPLTQVINARLLSIDNELGQAQTALQNARFELERTQRIVDATEQSMLTLKAEFTQAKTLFDAMNGTMDNQLIPGLKTTRANIEQAKNSLKELRASLEQINSLPFLDLNLPGDEVLANLIASADSLDTQIAQVEDLVKKASTFVGDASYMMGADFSETKRNLQNFLTVVTEYDQKMTGWRSQLAGLRVSIPGWIEGISIGLMIFMAWFGFSQISLIMQGLILWRGGDPLAVFRKPAVEEFQI